MTGEPELAVRVCLLGRARVERAGKPVDEVALGSRKARTLLWLLAARGASVVTADDLIAALWADDLPADANAVVASLVSRLRRTLGSGTIIGGRNGYRLGAHPAVTVDVDEIRALLEEADRHHIAGEPTLTLATLTSARRLVGDGRALAGDPATPWVECFRAEVLALHRRTLHGFARAAMAGDQPGAARDVAGELLDTDPLDETAARLLMRALLRLGETAHALRVYDSVRRHLADELGVDPAPATRELHLDILRGTSEPVTAEPADAGGPPPEMVGRDAEWALARRAWVAAVAGRGGCVLVTGEAGIGKTKLAAALADLVRRTGGTALSARCWEAERSLFLQPLVDAITTAVAAMPAARVRSAASEHGESLARLVPEVGELLGERAGRPGTAEVERRRAFRAVTAFLLGLGRDAPVLLLVDDVQHAGTSTLELLHYLVRRSARAPVLVVATVREDEGAEAMAVLASDARVVRLGPLSATDVAQLAGGAGHEVRTGEIMRRTGGHPLFVVEILRALAADDTALPESLQAAVLDRVARTGAQTARVLRAGAVLGAAFEPALAAALSGVSDAVALDGCERALAGRLLVPSGAQYEFAHDVVREVLLRTTPAPTAVAYHRRAAELLSDQPEALATHAAAAGDQPRAGHAWLSAARQALAGFAAADAAVLATRALAVSADIDDAELRGRALVVRGRARDARTDYAAAFDDFDAARTAAREAGDQRLEMLTLRHLAGDVPVALGRPPAECESPLRDCLALAERLGDRMVEADALDRLAVLACSRLDFVTALHCGERAVDTARASCDDDALAFGLDALKTTSAYLGDVARLAAVTAELEPLLRRRGDLWLLQWTVFERSFVHLAARDWARATASIEAALAVCRRSGYTVQEPFYIAHLGWTQRLAGRLDVALDLGHRALELASRHRHAWWSTTAASLYAATLVACGRSADAVPVLEAARAVADVPGAEAYLLRCLAALAEASGSREILDEASGLLATVSAPPGRAWLLGADAYLGIARAWAARGDLEHAAAVVAPFRAAAESAGWSMFVELADTVPS